MAAINLADDKVIYLGFNNIFQGQDSQIRKLPSIKKLVRKHRHEPPVSQLLKRYSEPVIYERLQRLLDCQVFESTAKANTKFPDLFEASRSQSAERAISEAEPEGAAGHDRAVEEAIASAQSYGKTCDSDYESDLDAEEPLAVQSTEQDSVLLGTGAPSLFPLKFQFTTGHRILIKTQEVLELACFRFVEKSMPEILTKRKWHCPESAELNLLAIEFLKRLGKFERLVPGAVSRSRPLKQLLPSIAQIRHHAVHRIPVTAKELEQFMADGETLAKLLEDQTAIRLMSQARAEVQKAAAELESRKRMLESKLANVLQEVAQKRAELDRIEAEAIADMQREDKEYQSFADAHLEDAIWSDDSGTGEGVFVASQPAVDEVYHECLKDEFNTALRPDMASRKDSKIEDCAEEGPMPLVLKESLMSDLGGDSVPAAIEEAPTQPQVPADWDGDGAETQKQELLDNSSADKDGPRTPGPRRLFFF